MTTSAEYEGIKDAPGKVQGSGDFDVSKIVSEAQKLLKALPTSAWKNTDVPHTGSIEIPPIAGPAGAGAVPQDKPGDTAIPPTITGAAIFEGRRIDFIKRNPDAPEPPPLSDKELREMLKHSKAVDPGWVDPGWVKPIEPDEPSDISAGIARSGTNCDPGYEDKTAPNLEELILGKREPRLTEVGGDPGYEDKTVPNLDKLIFGE